MNTTETDIQRIYNCKNNHNRIAIRLDYRCVVTWDNNMVISTEYFKHDGTELTHNDVNIRCGACGQYMVQSDVFAIENPESPCDLRCMHAIGPKCVCSCGGPNHGITWRIN